MVYGRKLGPIVISYEIEALGPLEGPLHWRVMRYMRGPLGSEIAEQRGPFYTDAATAVAAAEGLRVSLYRSIHQHVEALEGPEIVVHRPNPVDGL